MKLTDQVEINIPFSGFYESLYSGEIDSIEEREAEYQAEQQAENDIAEPLCLDASEFGSIFFDVSNYSVMYHAVARKYVEAYDTVISEATGIKLGLQFVEMTSPREYNFTTDRIFCKITLGTVARMFVKSRMEDHTTLAAAIAKRFTSRDGFISFYPNDLESWLAKPLTDWDPNELGTLLIAVHELSPDYDSDWRMAVYYETVEYEGVYNAWSDGVDWKKFDAKVAELRADKESELRELDPDFVTPPVRCKETPDLFKG